MLGRHCLQIFAAAAPLVILALYMLWSPAIWLLALVIPIIALDVFDIIQTKKTIRCLYPFLGRFRYKLEPVRSEIQQYFVESVTSGVPLPREFRSLVYQRATGNRDTHLFGTINDVNRPGYELLNHSLMPKASHVHDPRIQFGGDRRAKPYIASPSNLQFRPLPNRYGNTKPCALQSLVVSDKSQGVASLHCATVENSGELSATAGSGS